MTPWYFFVFVTRWIAAVFGTVAVGVAIVLFLIAMVYEIREMLL